MKEKYLWGANIPKPKIEEEEEEDSILTHSAKKKKKKKKKKKGGSSSTTATPTGTPQKIEEDGFSGEIFKK